MQNVAAAVLGHGGSVVRAVSSDPTVAVAPENYFAIIQHLLSRAEIAGTDRGTNAVFVLRQAPS